MDIDKILELRKEGSTAQQIVQKYPDQVWKVLKILHSQLTEKDKEIKKLKQTTIQLNKNGCCPYFEDGGLCGLIHGGIG